MHEWVGRPDRFEENQSLVVIDVWFSLLVRFGLGELLVWFY